MPLFAGAEQLMQELREDGFYLAVATGKNRNGLDRALNASKMGQYFHTTRTADQTVSKPDPTMLHEIMEELEIDAQRTLMVGDTTHDLQMAINAQISSIAVSCGAHPEDILQQFNPLMCLQQPAELLNIIRG